MSIPGFTAEAAVFRSLRQYRLNPSLSEPVKGVVPQLQSGGTCMNLECLYWCLDHIPYPETCYGSCQGPCDPNSPPEIFLASG
jgi:hypothetical protein